MGNRVRYLSTCTVAVTGVGRVPSPGTHTREHKLDHRGHTAAGWWLGLFLDQGRGTYISFLHSRSQPRRGRDHRGYE